MSGAGTHSNNMKQTNISRRRPWIIVVVVVVLVVVVTRVTTSKHKAALANDNFNGLFSLVFSENDKKQDEFLKKLERLQTQFVTAQEQRLVRIERQNERILELLKVLRVPPSQLAVRDKLVYMYPYDPKAKFPGYIWQLWKHGLNDDRFDSTYKEGQAQWAYKNPGFVHELFNDDTSFALVKHLYSYVPEVIEAYELLPEVVLRMDFFRYLILFARGGVYADVDTMPLQPVPNWIPENVSPTELGLIMAVGADSTSAQWRQTNHRRLEFGQFIIQSKPGHPILREMIAHITEETLRRKAELKDGEYMHMSGLPNEKQLEILRWTGLGLWTDTVMAYLNDYVKLSIYQAVTWTEFHALETPKLVSDILVLPLKSFALDLEVPKDGKISDPIAFAKHWSASIWKTT